MKGYKYRIYPNQEQIETIDKTISCCRYVWNGFLAMKEFRYKEFNEKMNYVKMSSILTQVKKTDIFLAEVDSTALQQTLKQLDNTFSMFFKGHCKFPRFKSMKNPKDSYKSTNIKIKDGKIYIPKVGFVEYSNSRDIKGRVLSAVVSKSATNKYYVSFTVDENNEHLPKIEKEVGVDLGLKTFAYTSDNEQYNLPKKIWGLEDRLIKQQRKLSKKKDKNSKSYKKQKAYVLTLHERITNIRKDFQHKLSTELVKRYGYIAIEDLNIKGMMSNRKLARAIGRCSFYEFRRMLEYKCKEHDREFIVIDRWFASSKTCSSCGRHKADLKLSDRTYICSECGIEIDRDYNASINIRDWKN